MKSGNAKPTNAILSGLKNGDQHALEELLSMYREALVASAYVILGDTAEAEDVVQEVFLKLWDKRATLEPDSQIENFLFTVVSNHCFSVLRKQKSLKLKEAKFFYGLVGSYNGSPLENAELNRQLWTAISALPPAEQKYFLLSYLDGESHKEIAERNNITTQVVKNAVWKALQKLREKLKGKV